MLVKIFWKPCEIQYIISCRLFLRTKVFLVELERAGLVRSLSVCLTDCSSLESRLRDLLSSLTNGFCTSLSKETFTQDVHNLIFPGSYIFVCLIFLNIIYRPQINYSDKKQIFDFGGNIRFLGPTGFILCQLELIVEDSLGQVRS